MPVGGGQRLYQGRDRLSPATPWVCPSCGVQNVGRLEDGCQNARCPTRQPTAAPPSIAATGKLDAVHSFAVRLVTTETGWSGSLVASWVTPVLLAEGKTEWEVFDALLAHLRALGGPHQPDTTPVPAESPRSTLASLAPIVAIIPVDPDGYYLESFDKRTQQTIASALALYADNTPGEVDQTEWLTPDEARQLGMRLLPAEESQ